MNVLCIAAHPDDEVLGVGGTLLRHKDAGDTVTVALLYPCRVDDDTIAEAQKRMGLPYEWWTDDLDELVLRIKPDTVYVHSAADLHHEHHEAVQRALVACRPQSGVRNLYAFETPSATDWGPRPFTPQRFVDITSTMVTKLRAMDAYSDELRKYQHPRSMEALRERAAYWGQRVGVRAAEAFEVIRECW